MHPEQFYLAQKSKTEELISKSKKKSFLFSMLRLSAFLGIFAVIYSLISWPNLAIGGGVLMVVLFLAFIKRSASINEKLNYEKEKLKLIDLEIAGLLGDFSGFKNGSEHALPNHDFTYDLDVFGDRSIFQMLNRTSTKEGEKLLATMINENEVTNVLARQEAIKELEQLPDDRLHFHAQAKVLDAEITPQELVNYLTEYKSFVPKFWKPISFLFAGISILAIIGVVSNLIASTYLLYWFLLGIGISGVYFKKVTKVQQKLDKARFILLNYSKLIAHLETRKFTAPLLVERHAEFVSDQQRFSETLGKLYGYLNALDQRQNIVFAPLGAGFFLWDIQQMLKIEKWINLHSTNISKLFENLAFFDAYYALGHYNFLNPSYTTPIVSEEDAILAKDLIHPLMKKEGAVSNSLEIKRGEFFIITGANMAGKSTFLRTVGTAILLSNVGLNIRASSFSYKPLRIISSMRTEDSLQDNESYFFAELQRLKYINDRLANESCFVILDEILKGTNSKDKAEGSRKYVATLLKSNATGIIATHDLSLCELEKEYKAIKNYCFEAQIENDELFFDYAFKEGICQNMNASFLLRKMKIVSDDV